MNADRLPRPVLGALLFAGWLAFAGEPAANPEAGPVPPLRHPPPGAALHRRPFVETVEQLDLMARFALAQAGGVPARSHFCVPADVGVAPEAPPPRWWKGPRR